MSKQKAFTLIELLVVITVIGLLSSIIFMSLASARNKARDSAIKTSLSQLRGAGEIHADDAGTYIGFCNSDNVLKIEQGVSSNKSNLICDSDLSNAWAACAQLVADISYFYCADSAGNSVELLGTCKSSVVDDGDCYSPFCGDANLDPLEECDDGNLIDGDGCSSICQL